MKTSFPNLQLVRFLAAAMVLLSHVQHEALSMRFGGSPYTSWDAIYLGGGVDIFFVVSGFIMYAISSKEFGVPGGAGRFFLRRLVRIVPPYWLFTAAMIVAAIVFASHIHHPNLSWQHIVASFFFIPFPNAYGEVYPMLILGWTLNYEFFFYVVFGLALLFPKAQGLTFVFGVIGGMSLFGFADMFDHAPLAYWSNPLILEFLLGILLAMAREKGLRCSPATSIFLVVAAFVAMYVLKTTLDIAQHFWAARVLWMGLPALAICAAAVLVEQAPKATGVKKGLVFMGDASYALYLSHPFALNLVALLWNKSGLGQPYLYIMVSCLFSLLVGALVHVWIEKPMTDYLNNKIRSRTVRPQANAAPIGVKE